MKTVLVTGANKGIGFEIVQRLLKKNYRVLAISRSTTNLRDIDDNNLKVYQCDIREKEQLEEIRNYIIKSGIKIDILVNNLGVGYFDKAENISIDDFQKVIFFFFLVPFYMISMVLPEMKERNWGRIITIGSDAAFLSEINGTAYCSSKFGLRGLCECIKKEVENYNISVSMVNPGRVDTWFNNKKPGDRKLALSAEQIATQVDFILSQDDFCCIEYINLYYNKK